MIKDKKYLENKGSQCLDLAKKFGATDCEVLVSNSIEETVSFRNKILDESNRSDSLVASITTFIGKKKSSIASSNLLDDNLKTLIERCVETTKLTPEDEYNSLPDKDLYSKSNLNLELYDEQNYQNDKKIDYLKELDEKVFEEKKVINTESGFSQNKSNFILMNSDGFQGSQNASSFSASCVVVAKSQDGMERDYEYTNKCYLNDIKRPSELAKLAIDRTIKKLNPKKIGSEKINLIFDKRIAKGFLGAFTGAISSSAISRGTSFLKDKIDQKVFSDSINIIDKPDIKRGLGSQIFDREGVQSNELKLIDNGVLKNYLVDTYNGKKLNLKSNGRAGGSTNLYFEKGKKSFGELLNLTPRALYITETIGHGTNLITGDYSVGAAGYIVENGEIKEPVNEITIAGNFKEMFKNITLADDLEFDYATNSPTMMIEGMVVAGK